MTQDFWTFCLSRLEQELPQQQFNTWIKTLRAEPGEGGWALIAPNRFVLQWVRERYLRRVEELGEDGCINLSIHDNLFLRRIIQFEIR